MRHEIGIVNPLTCPDWDGLLLRSGKGSFFQSAAWVRVLNESYGYVPAFFAACDGRCVQALLPVMEVRSVLTGRRGVAIPFSDYCEPVVSEDVPLETMIDEATVYGKSRGWRFLEIRSGSPIPGDASLSARYLGHVLPLGGTEEEVWNRLRDSTRRNVKKARKEGVSVRISGSVEAMEAFCRLNAVTRRNHGLPPQPRRFFQEVHRHVLSEGMGFVALASCRGATIAGAVYFHFGGKAIYKYGASDKRFEHLRANNLVMWEAIDWYRRNGFESLCFGRTDLENSGLVQYKSGWGASQRDIRYYRVGLTEAAVPLAGPNVYGFHNRIVSRTPLPVLNLVGSLLYRHLG